MPGVRGDLVTRAVNTGSATTYGFNADSLPAVPKETLAL